MFTKFAVVSVLVQYIYCSEIFRLDESVRPHHYDLEITPNFLDDTFTGYISIDLSLKSAKPNITLHSSITIKDIVFDGNKAQYESKEDLLTIFPDEENKVFPEGNYNVKINYTGEFISWNLSPSMEGFRKEKYDRNNDDSIVYVTDFEPSGARRAFPCFDEPSFKATFKVSLVSPNSSYKALSNMELIKEVSSQEGTRYEFEKSVPMSPYLVCMVFTDLSYLEKNVTINGKEINLRTYSKDLDNSIALNITQSTLEYYTNYTGFEYSLKKLYFIEYLKNKSVATENWGMITVKAEHLGLHFLDEYQINTIIGHEVGHSWFGNLVTNNWWGDLWLQEGLVTYFAKKFIYASFKYCNYYDYDFDDDLEGPNSHTVVVKKLTSKQILQHEMFDDITYLKGSDIFRSMEDAMGPEVFQKVIRKYFKAYQYKSADAQDFIDLVKSENPGEYWQDFIESYIYQISYPFINIKKDGDYYVLTQSVWCHKKQCNLYKESNWTIPIKFSTDKTKETTLVWFSRDLKELKIPVNDTKYIVLNPNLMGLYRYNYDENLWNTIIENAGSMKVEEQKSVTREADLMYSTDWENCSIPALLFGKIKKENRKLLNFLLDTKFLELYDKDAAKKFEKYVNYVQSSMNNTKLLPMAYFYTKPPYTITHTDRLTSCINWIHESLSKYTVDEIQNNEI